MRIGIHGCCGRLGRLTLGALLRDSRFELAGCVTSPSSKWLGRDAGELLAANPTGILIGHDVDALCRTSDAVIDFSVPQAAAQLATTAACHGCGVVTGTTGLDARQQDAVALAARHIPVMQASHMSLAATLMMAAVEQLAAHLDAAYDLEIVGIGHRRKADVPSGTSWALARAAAAARGVDPSAIRTGPGEGPHEPGRIGISAWRGGENYSEHQAVFAGRGDRLAISHAVTSYEVCAEGALHAALWLVRRKPGHYTMRDVLGLASTRQQQETT